MEIYLFVTTCTIDVHRAGVLSVGHSNARRSYKTKTIAQIYKEKRLL